MFWNRIKRLQKTIAFRMAVSLGLTSALLLTALCVLFYWAVSWQVTTDNNRFMDDVTSLVRATLSSQDNLLPILNRQIPRELSAFHFNRYQLRIVPADRQDDPFFQSPHFPVQVKPKLKHLSLYRLGEPLGDGQLVMLPDGTILLMLAAEAKIGQTKPQRAIIQLALDVTSKMQLLKRLEVNLLIFVLAGTVLFGLMGSWLVKRGLVPLQDFGEVIQGIRMDSLDQRINTHAWPQELRPLAQSFDRLLARLQKDVDQLTRFSGDLAHELRTPLTTLRIEMEVLLAHDRSVAEYRTALENNLGELERLSGLVERLLLLARVDSPQFSGQWQQVAVRPVVEKLIDFYALLAEDKQITLSVTGTLQLNADVQLLEQAIGNLLSNAIKYTPRGGKVQVALSSVTEGDDESMGVIEVQDNGAGIPTADLPHVFDRFYRGDQSRSQTIAGDGLGLAIVKSIMDNHGGKVQVTSAGLGHGALFRLLFNT